MHSDLVSGLTEASRAPGNGLARAALAIARIEYPRLEPATYLARLDAMGADARDAIDRHVQRAGDDSTLARVRGLNQYLFQELRFTGNRDRYEDPRNSCLNEVIERRTGIPITLSVVYLEVARRAGLEVDGVNFPGHFLVRCAGPRGGRRLIIDPFHEGTLLSERDCRRLLQRHAGPEAPFRRSLLAPATREQIIVRILSNLKRIYVHMRSFPQARDTTELLLAVAPSALGEIRDRGLIAYHLNDVQSALRDLQAYLRLSGVGASREARDERTQIWEHVKALRRRVAGLN